MTRVGHGAAEGPLDASLERHVGCHLEAELSGESGLVLAVAVADPSPATLVESLGVTLDGHPLPVTEVTGPGGTRWHATHSGPGALVVDYRATVTGRPAAHPVAPVDRIVHVRPSRYAQADLLYGDLLPDGLIERFMAIPPRHRVLVVRDWVHEALDYRQGTTSPTDSVIEALEHAHGVCRDFAHVTAAILRATDLPARTVSVYAPQLVPMDFHAVVEVAIDDEWLLLDATGLAPREGMLRIATGRDSADTAFLANDGSWLTLTGIRVTATASQEFSEDSNAEVALR